MEHSVAALVVALLGIAVAVAMTVQRTRQAERARNDVPPQKRDDRMMPPADALPDLTTSTQPTREIPDDALDWIGMAADELRAPLDALRGYAEDLRRHLDTAPRDALGAAFDRLLAQIDRMDGMIEAWSVTAEMTTKQRAPASRPAELQALARKICSRLAGAGAPLYEVAEGPELWALVDISLIDQALQALLRGARRATPQGLVEIDARAISQGAETRISLAIADRRPPPRGQHPDLWEAIEIDLARVLVEEMGGWIELSDRAGGGAVTTIWLPGTLLLPTPRPRSAFETAQRQTVRQAS
jgi:signal transduction histidine kinase